MVELSHGRLPFRNLRVSPSSERLHKQMWSHRFDTISQSTMSGCNNMSYKYYWICFDICMHSLLRFGGKSCNRSLCQVSKKPVRLERDVAQSYTSSDLYCPRYDNCLIQFRLSRSQSSLDVEETSGTIYFDLVRSHGSLDKVSVDVVTSAGTAASHVGPHMRLARVQVVGMPRFWDRITA